MRVSVFECVSVCIQHWLRRKCERAMNVWLCRVYVLVSLSMCMRVSVFECVYACVGCMCW